MFLVGPCNKAYLCRPVAHSLYKDFCLNNFAKGMENRDYPITLCKTTPSTDFDCFGYQPVAWSSNNAQVRGPDWDQDNIIDYV